MRHFIIIIPWYPPPSQNSATTTHRQSGLLETSFDWDTSEDSQEDSGVSLASSEEVILTTSEVLLTTSEVLQPTSEVIDVDEGFIDTSEAATDPMVEDQTLLHTLQEKLRWVLSNIYVEKYSKLDM